MQNVVYFVVDQTYLPMALANASALVDQESRNFDVVIFLAGGDASGFKVPEGVRIAPIDVERMVPAGIETSGPWRRIVYARIFCPLVLAGEYRRALYLDADVGIFRPVSPLFTLDMKGMPLAAVEGVIIRDPAFHQINLAAYELALGIHDGDFTFNSGVLLIDIAEWNRVDHASSLHRFTSDIQPRLEREVKIVLPDQDYLNWVLNGQWLKLSPRWNFQTFLLRLALEELVDPAIVHYVGPRRPWHELLFPFGSRHSNYYTERLRSIGMTDLSRIRPRSYYRRYLADRIRQLAHNQLGTANKRRMFEEWQSTRKTFKEAIAARVQSGEYEDVRQGICVIDLSNDSFAGATIDDALYYRKQIRVSTPLATSS